MKKFNFKKFLLLFSVLVCAFSLTACTDSISVNAAKQNAKEIKLQNDKDAIEAWAKDIIIYLDKNDDAAIMKDAEDAKTLDKANNKTYVVNPDGMNTKTIEFYNSWMKSKEDLGKLISIDAVTITGSDETANLCTVAVETTFEVRKCSFEIIIDNNLDISSAAINPAFTTGEKMSKAGLNTLIGMGTVFVVLIFISFIISLLKYVNKPKKVEENKVETTAMPAAPAVSVEPEDDLELIAVITAAIAASEGTSSNGLVVRSIRKVDKRR